MPPASEYNVDFNLQEKGRIDQLSATPVSRTLEIRIIAAFITGEIAKDLLGRIIVQFAKHAK